MIYRRLNTNPSLSPISWKGHPNISRTNFRELAVERKANIKKEDI
jgi:hypothetical protein